MGVCFSSVGIRSAPEQRRAAAAWVAPRCWVASGAGDGDRWVAKGGSSVPGAGVRGDSRQLPGAELLLALGHVPAPREAAASRRNAGEVQQAPWAASWGRARCASAWQMEEPRGIRAPKTGGRGARSLEEKEVPREPHRGARRGAIGVPPLSSHPVGTKPSRLPGPKIFTASPNRATPSKRSCGEPGELCTWRGCAKTGARAHRRGRES